jgi:hypothetical protein
VGAAIASESGGLASLRVSRWAAPIPLLWHSDGFALTLTGRIFQGTGSAPPGTGGSVTAPIISGAPYQYGGYSLPFLILCGFGLADAALRVLLLSPDQPHQAGDPGPFRLLTHRAVAAPTLAVAIAAGSWDILEPVLSRHLERTFGAGAAEIGLIFTLSTTVYGFTLAAGQLRDGTVWDDAHRCPRHRAEGVVAAGARAHAGPHSHWPGDERFGARCVIVRSLQRRTNATLCQHNPARVHPADSWVNQSHTNCA